MDCLHLWKKTNLGSKLLVSYYLTDGSFVWIRLRLRKDLVLGKNIKLKLRLNYQLVAIPSVYYLVART